MAIRSDWVVTTAGKLVLFENAYHYVDRVSGSADSAIAIVRVQEGPNMPVLTTWSFKFTPVVGGGDWRSQAYEAMKLDERIKGFVDDFTESNPLPRRTEDFEARRDRIKAERKAMAERMAELDAQHAEIEARRPPK